LRKRQRTLNSCQPSTQKLFGDSGNPPHNPEVGDAETKHFHAPVTGIVITYPVMASNAMRENLKQAAIEAGFTDVELLKEPEAAAISHMTSSQNIGRSVLVYDFGGGTFDLAFMTQLKPGEWHFPVVPKGLTECGGDYLDQLLYDHFDNQCRQNYSEGFSRDDSVNLSVLLQCRKLPRGSHERNHDGHVSSRQPSKPRIFPDA